MTHQNHESDKPGAHPSTFSARWALVFSGLIVVLIVLLLVQRNDSPPLPEELGSLKLEQRLTGQVAKEVVDQLHGKRVSPMTTSIGHYRHGVTTAVLYISTYSSEGKARRDEKMMRDHISGGNPVFHDYAEMQFGALGIASCFGLGQLHYFFAHGRNLYWLAVDPPAAADAIHGLVRSISK